MEPIISIIKGCIANDRRYQKMLYDRYRGYALKIVFRYIFRYEKAHDVVTDGFVKLFTHISTFKVDDRLDTEKILMGWIRRIMINAAIDEVRRSQLLLQTSTISDHVWDIPDKSGNADLLVLYRDLMMVLDKLPAQYRLIFNMHVIDGYGHHEIAKMLKISLSASKSGLSRARALIQKYITEEEQFIYVFSEPGYG